MTTAPARDPDSLLPLRTNWFHILAVLSESDQHGYAIMQEVNEQTQNKVRLWPATLYGAIKKLLEEELITEIDDRPSAEDDDARRRYYRITPFGRQVLNAELGRLRELVSFVESRSSVQKAEA